MKKLLLWQIQILLLTLFFQERPAEAQPRPLKKSGAIVFPDSNLCLDGRGGMYDISYCNQVKDYPSQSELDLILKHEFFSLEYYIYEDVLLPPNISQRTDALMEDIELCGSREKVVYPQGGYTKDNTWMLILNNNDTFKQGVRVEECIKEGETCNAVTFPNHYTAICEQKYNLRTLWALTDNKTRVMDSFKMPSCCQCVVKWKK